MMRATLVTVLAIVVLAVESPQPVRGEDLLEFAIRAHEATVQLIHDFSCKVDLEIKNFRGSEVKTVKMSGRYWRSGNRVRAIEESPGRSTRDFFLDGSILRVLERRGQAVSGSIRDGTAQDMTLCDAYRGGLLRLQIPNGFLSSLPLRGFLAEASSAVKSERRKEEGRDTIVLRFTTDRPYTLRQSWDVELHLDAEANYLVRRAIYRTVEPKSGMKATRDFRVDSFSEVAPSIYFPASAIYDSRLGDETKASSTMRFLGVVVNKPLPADAFAFRFTGGVEVNDRIRNGRYRVDDLGNRTSAEEPLGRKVVPPPGSTTLPEPGMATQSEPTSWTAWLPLGFGLLFVVSAGCWIFSRWRARDEMST